MVKIARLPSAWVACFAVVTLLACGCGSQRGAPADATGSLAMSLAAVANGAMYRLSNVQIFVSGPSSRFLTEGDPSEKVIAVSLQTGNYNVFLETWVLQRADAQGNFQPVMATLESNSSQSVSIFNGTTTTLTYRFKTDGVIVIIGSGQLDVTAAVDMVPPVCTPLGADCPSGSWCPPAGLTGAALACVTAGTASVGQPCAGPADCVANASCFDSGSGPVCTALCAGANFNAPCASGGVCQAAPARSDYGLCVPVADASVADGSASDANASDGSANDGPAGETTQDILSARGSACLACVTENGCLDPAQLGGTCEGVAGIASSGCNPVFGVTSGSITEAQVCRGTLNAIFASGCGQVGQLTPCLCGTTTIPTCESGSASPTGPIFPEYVCDFGTTDVLTILLELALPTFGAGMADSIVECAQQNGCGCF
jgi:hypothetical protein